MVAPFVFGRLDPDLVERASRLRPPEARELVGSVVTFALWWFGLWALAVVVLGVALEAWW
jgi:hypothetical protein